jgi:hypothetical protein
MGTHWYSHSTLLEGDSTGFGTVSYSVEGFQTNPNAVPEPATMLLLGAGLIGLAGYGRKKSFKK